MVPPTTAPVRSRLVRSSGQNRKGERDRDHQEQTGRAELQVPASYVVRFSRHDLSSPGSTSQPSVCRAIRAPSRRASSSPGAYIGEHGSRRSCPAREMPCAAGAAASAIHAASARSSPAAALTARRSSGAAQVQREGRCASRTARSMLSARARRLPRAVTCVARSASSGSQHGSPPAASSRSSVPRRSMRCSDRHCGKCWGSCVKPPSRQGAVA